MASTMKTSGREIPREIEQGFAGMDPTNRFWVALQAVLARMEEPEVRAVCGRESTAETRAYDAGRLAMLQDVRHRLEGYRVRANSGG